MSLNRRRVLRGMLNGGAVTVALPLLDCFLNGNGNAMADGGPMPVRFGTWFWALGGNKPIFKPKETGAKYALTEELTALKDVQQHINLVTDLTCHRDGPVFCHFTGWVVMRTGMAPALGGQIPLETIDVTIANQIGKASRFKLLSATATSDIRTVYSYENSNSPNTPEISPLSFYRRLFGTEFQDPNAANFMPDPQAMVRKSALSAVKDQIKVLETRIGAEDRQRLDQYLTGVRYIEHQLDQRLKKPEPIKACTAPRAPEDSIPSGIEADLVSARHRAMTDLMVMAIACDQTRVFNMAYANAFSNIIRPNYDKPHHTCTHEEPIDQKLGYQPNHSWYVRKAMEEWAYFVSAFTKIKEGDGSLLDNLLLYANTDVGTARSHTVDDVPAFTAGRAGGRLKTGLHVDGAGRHATSLGYTALKVMGLELSSWGRRSNVTSKELSEILV